MSEHEIMWIGRQPGADPGTTLPTDEPAFEARLREACEAAGCPVERYVAARGAGGSWLIELRRADETQRLIWNGKAGRLSLDRPNRGGGWDELLSQALELADLDAMTAAMQHILRKS